MRSNGNPVLRRRCRHGAAARRATWTRLRKSGDSVGAKVTVVAQGVPVGWGEPVYDRLDADIAYAMMGINAVKGRGNRRGFRLGDAEGQRARRRD